MIQKLKRWMQFTACTLCICIMTFLVTQWDSSQTPGSEIGIYIFKENNPLIQYVNASQNNKMGFLMQYVANSSSLVTYVMAQEEGKMQSEVQTASVEEALEENKKAIAKGTVASGVESFIFGESYIEAMSKAEVDENTVSEAGVVTTPANLLQLNQNKINKLKASLDSKYLIKNFYIVDSTTSVDSSVFNVKSLLEKDLTIKKDNTKPQILIYHTHAVSESFIDSKPGQEEESVVGIGSCLSTILTDKYGYQVYHDKSKYDLINGSIDRDNAYNAALPTVTQILKDNPSIKVVIDLHRDGVNGSVHTTTDVNGNKAARVMLFNGMSRNRNGEIQYLANPNREDNLAFSLQMKIKAMELYPDLTKPIYLKGYRYNQHVVGRCLLVELGNQNNTVEEARNAMAPLAEVLDKVLSGEK